MNLFKLKLVDIFNPKKWVIFARFLENKTLRKKYKELSVPEYKEQIVYRMNKCPNCVDNKSCVECGCKSPELFYDKDNWCELKRWEQMVRPELWEDYKKINGITINPDNLKELEQFGELKWLKKKTK